MHAPEPRVPAEDHRLRLVRLEGHRHLQAVAVNREPLRHPATERPALVEVDRDRVVAVTRHGRSYTTPWIACGGIVIGSRCSTPAKENRPRRIRPAHGAMG